MHALVIGHWSSDRGGYEALGALVTALRQARPDCHVCFLPAGPGQTFLDALSAHAIQEGSALTPICVDDREGTSARLAEAILGAVHDRRIAYIEGGHLDAFDGGISLLEQLSDQQLPRDARLAEPAMQALRIARSRLQTVSLIFAASTSRPLLGLDSVSALAPNLMGRIQQETVFLGALSKFYQLASKELARERHVLPVLQSSVRADDTIENIARQPGSGAGGGAAAMIRLLGGRVFPTGDVLYHLMDLDVTLGKTDLVITCEPQLHGPLVADSPLHAVRQHAQDFALPVVAVSEDSTLGRREMAEEGIHGMFTTRQESERVRGLEINGVSTSSLNDDLLTMGKVGRRIASTWLP